MQQYFTDEYHRVVDLVNKKRQEADIAFVLLTDSHLSDNGEHTWQNIAEVDKAIHFDFMVHMGDFLTGSTPEKISRKNLKSELEGYRGALNNRTLYVVQGNHDGYRDESFQGQLVDNIALDQNWYEDTCFMDQTSKNFHRPGNKPYYYVDYPDTSFRLIVLCSMCYDVDMKKKIYRKKYEFTSEQLKWLGEEALNTPDNYATIVFSHIQPFSEVKFIQHEKAVRWSSNYRGAAMLLQAYREGTYAEVGDRRYSFKRRGNLIGWFFGHNHGDFQACFNGINYVETASQDAYIPQLWEPIGEFPVPRDMGTENEDVWDAVLWCREKRMLYMYRFGAGNDRIVHY